MAVPVPPANKARTPRRPTRLVTVHDPPADRHPLAAVAKLCGWDVGRQACDCAGIYAQAGIDALRLREAPYVAVVSHEPGVSGLAFAAESVPCMPVWLRLYPHPGYRTAVALGSTVLTGRPHTVALLAGDLAGAHLDAKMPVPVSLPHRKACRLKRLVAIQHRVTCTGQLCTTLSYATGSARRPGPVWDFTVPGATPMRA